MKRRIGFDRNLTLRWLDIGASLAESEQDKAALRGKLMEALAAEIPAHFVRYKTCTVLIRTWLSVPPSQLEMRNQAFDLLKHATADQRLAVHWGMLLLAYPFFRDTVSAIGRAAMSQGVISRGQTKRRIVETWGDRATVRRCLRYVFQSLVDWGILITDDADSYHVAAPLDIQNSRLALWFAQATILARESPISFSSLRMMPETFAFESHLSTAEITRSGMFDTFREGSDLLVGVRT